jgi:hypothetical protein
MILTYTALIHSYSSLQHLPNPRQILASPPIPAYLGDTTNEASMLHSNRFHRCLRNLSYRIFNIHLHPYSSLLGLEHPRKVFLRLNILVHDLELEHRD